MENESPLDAGNVLLGTTAGFSADINTIMLSTILALVAAIVGTYFGARLINYRNEKKIKNVRKIAIRGLNIINDYTKNNRTYCDVKNEFNNKLNIAEKRAVLVCLHKLGIPIKMPIGKTFDVKDVQFLPKIICKDEIEWIIMQITSGHCDHLFYNDVDSYFMENVRIKSIRDIGKKYVTGILSKSIIDTNTGNLTYPKNLEELFSFGEFQAIGVFEMKIQEKHHYYFNKTGNPDEIKINQLIEELDIGLWDSSLQWDYSAYQNMQIQRSAAMIAADAVGKMFSPNNQKNKDNSSQEHEKND